MNSTLIGIVLTGALGLAAIPAMAELEAGGTAPETATAETENLQARSNSESLSQAADAGELQRLLDLLEDGTPIDSQNESGNTALHLAAFRGRLPVVVALLERGADVSIKDKGGFAALDWASANGFDAVAAKLLNAGAKVDSRDLLGNTALSWAAANGHMDVIETLLARGADPAAANADGDTPMHLAAANGELEACALLLDRSAPVEIENNEGQTPIQVAASEYYSDIVELLLVSGEGGEPPADALEASDRPEPGSSIPPGRMTRKSRVLEDIRRFGGIVIGYRQAAVPFSYLGPDRTPMGYSIDLCQELVSAIETALGIEDLPVKWLPVNPETRLVAIDTGEVQLDCGVTTHTLGRRELADFSPTTFITGTKLLVKADSGIQGVDDLKGRRIAAQKATTNARALSASAEKARIAIELLPVPDAPAGYRAVAKGDADAYAADHILLHALVHRAAEPDTYRIVGDFLSYDPYAIGLPRNDSAFTLLVERRLAGLFRSGEIEKLYAKWFGPLKVPMPDLLKSAFRLQALPE